MTERDLNAEIDAAIARTEQAMNKPPAEPPPKKNLSLDDVMDRITEIADDAGNRDQFKALKMLAAAKASSAALPDPLTSAEVIDRLVRLMRPAGMEECQIAYRRAFKNSKTTIETQVEVTTGDLPPETMEKVNKITSLRIFYKVFPELKAPGLPKGFPIGRSIERKREWLRKEAIRMFLDREQALLDKVVAEDKAILAEGEGASS